MLEQQHNWISQPLPLPPDTLRLPLLTLEDLDTMPDDGNKYELLGGEIFMSRAPHISHQLALANTLGNIFAYLQKHPIGKIIPEPGVIFSDYDAVIPDLVFISEERYKKIVSDEGKIIAAPDLVIEVMSLGPKDVRRDRVTKLQLYSRYGVKEYWIIDYFSLYVEIYRPTEKGLELAEKLDLRDELRSPLLPDFSLPVSAIFQQ